LDFCPTEAEFSKQRSPISEQNYITDFFAGPVGQYVALRVYVGRLRVRLSDGKSSEALPRGDKDDAAMHSALRQVFRACSATAFH
jgi:hypothetical protein